MIDTVYHVACDGPHPDDPADLCEAEFTLDCDDSLSNVAKLRRQLDQRGWRIVTGSRPLRVLCPLHPEPGR